MLKKYLKISLIVALGLISLVATDSAEAAGITLSPPKFEEVVNPGETVQKLIKVTNSGEGTISLSMSAQDFVAKGEAGQQEYIETDSDNPQPHLLSSWIRYNKDPITIEPGKTAKVPFSIKIPENAEPGGHYGTIFFSPPVDKDAQVAIVQRIGSLILVRVTGEITEEARLDSFGIYGVKVGSEGNVIDIDTAELDEHSEKSFFETLPVGFVTRIENTGNVHTKAQGTITLFNTFGSKLTQVGVEPILNNRGLEIDKEIVDYIPFNPEGGNVLPNSFRGFQQVWQGFPRLVFDETTGEKVVKYGGFGFGRYKAVLGLKYGSSKIDLPVREMTFWIIPWKLILVAIIILIVLFFVSRTVRKRSHGKKKEMEAEIRRRLMEEMKGS